MSHNTKGDIEIRRLKRERGKDRERQEREHREMHERLAARDAAYEAAYGKDYGRERKVLNLQPLFMVADGENARNGGHGLSIAGKRAMLRKVERAAAKNAAKKEAERDALLAARGKAVAV